MANPRIPVRPERDFATEVGAEALAPRGRAQRRREQRRRFDRSRASEARGLAVMGRGPNDDGHGAR